MAKFSGVVGFVDEAVETSPGIWNETITERSYQGDVVKDILKFREADKINNDLSVSNLISIVADAYASEHIFAMRYVKWQGVLWVVSNVDVQSPRLILRLGGLYVGNSS